MSDLAKILIVLYLAGVFVSFLFWAQGEIEGYSVVWWPITLVKSLARSLWDAIRY